MMIAFTVAWLLFVIVVAPAIIMKRYPPTDHELDEPWWIGIR